MCHIYLYVLREPHPFFRYPGGGVWIEDCYLIDGHQQQGRRTIRPVSLTGQMRTVTINDEPWFVGKDVAQVLGYGNSRKALAGHVSEEDKQDGVTIRDTIGREQNPVFINESGLYSLILSSKLPGDGVAFHRPMGSMPHHAVYCLKRITKPPQSWFIPWRLLIGAYTAKVDRRSDPLALLKIRQGNAPTSPNKGDGCRSSGSPFR